MKQPYDLLKNQDRDSCNNNKRVSKLYITVVFLMLHGLYIGVTVWWIYLPYRNIGSKYMKHILDQLTNKNGSLFGIIATIYAIKMKIYFFQVDIWINLNNGVLSLWWNYLLFKNIDVKHMKKPPEQTENKNGFLYVITLTVYEIKMDIHLIMLVFVCYINGKICRIIRVFDMYYGWNFRPKKKAMLIAIMKSQLITSSQFQHARIAYRLTIEKQGEIRIINEPTTEWVAGIMDIIKPAMNNSVLWTNGNFKPLLEELLGNESIKKDFIQLFDYINVLEIFNSLYDSKQDDMDLDLKENESELTKMETFELYKQCLDRTFKDNVCGIFNRSVWGHLKQLKPPKDPLTLRNKLRLSLNTTQRKFSSLQVHE